MLAAPPPPYPRAEMMRRVAARVEAGWSFTTLGREPGFPGRQTLMRWAKADAEFAARVARARALGCDARRRARLAAQAYDEARAQAFLLRVRRGDTVGDLLRTPGQPHRRVLERWRREQPGFAAALKASLRFSRQERPRKWRFDQAVADEMVRRVWRGETLRALARDPGFPTELALAGWRRVRPDFDAALRMAMGVGHGARKAAGRRVSPDLTDAIALHILAGGSLKSAGARPDMPWPQTLYGWMRTRPEFAHAIGVAQQMRDEMIVERAMELAERLTPETAKEGAAELAQARLRLGRLTVGAPRGPRPKGG